MFVREGGSLNAAHSAVEVSAEAVGFQACGVQLDYVTAKAGDTYSALQLHVDSLSVVGITALELYVSNLDVKANRSTSLTKVDWSAQGVAVTLPASAADLDVSATFGVNLGSGLAVAAGTVRFSNHTGSGLLSATSILQLSISDGSLFVGVGGSLNAAHSAVEVSADAVGFQASGVQLDYVTAKAGDTYSALQLHVDSLSVVGITGLELYVSNLDVKVNKSTSLTKIDWSAQGVAVTLPASASDLDVSATFAVNLGSGLAVAAGTVHFTTHAGSGPLAGTSILQLSISDGSLFVGVGGSLNAAHTAVSVSADAVGFQASGVQLDYVTAKAGDTYSALQLHVDSLSVVGITGLELYVSNLDVKANKSTSLTKIDWSAQGVAVTLPASAADLDVSATFAVNLGSGLAVAAGTGPFLDHNGFGGLAW